jgi:stage II sporulation protein AA (anti-sigma F factor antagonist)
MSLPFSNGPSPENGRGARELRVQLDRLTEQRLCVRVAGELELATSEELSSKLSEILTEPQEVVLDLGGVTFMDSAGLAVIINATKRAEMIGAQLEIASPLPSQSQRLLELTGMVERVTFTATPPRPAD